MTMREEIARYTSLTEQRVRVSKISCIVYLKQFYTKNV